MNSQPKDNPCLEAALSYASSGMPVFPIVAGTKTPACTHGVKDATCLADVVLKLWRAVPDASVAIAGGGTKRLIVIDVDGAIGRESLRFLEIELGKLPDTLTSETPRGGNHLLYAFPVSHDLEKVRNTVGALGVKLDVRARNGYIVAPPSPGYRWLNELPVAELPPAWAARLVSLKTGYAEAALRDACTKITQCPEGERNNTLNREAFSLGGFVATGKLSEFVVAESLLQAALRAGLGEKEARNTIASGLAAGKERPRDEPTDFVAGGQGWMHSLIKRNEKYTKDPGNATLLLARHSLWEGTLGYSEFSDKIFWRKDPPVIDGMQCPKAGDEFAEHHATYVQLALAKTVTNEFPTFSRTTILDCVIDAARQNSRHEARDWFESLEWDTTRRVDSWLTNYLGAPDTEYVSRVGRWWLIGAVARLFKPGCQCDHVLVLRGSQGCGKSTAARILGDEWFLGSLPDLRDKDAVQALQGRWIVELGELDALRGAAGTRVKDFLTQPVDIYRPSYGRYTVKRQRQCVFIGSTNESHPLTDPTGARRFWVVGVKDLRREELERDRIQILAEAYTLFFDGNRWWPEGDEHWGLAEEQENHYAIDAWEPLVANWAATRTQFTIGDVLEGAIRLSPERWDRYSQTRVGSILRRLGFETYRPRNGSRIRVYVRQGEPTWET